MYESKLLSLISEGENEYVEFKRELHLDTTDGKAEFVKDIISLANSASESGCMLIGVDNNKQIVGIGILEEERIQQISSTYIDPVVVLRCSVISVQSATSFLVGVIEVLTKNKPHKVSRPIGKLNQNEVFVRHGSVVARASPEEIINMDRASQVDAERKQLIRSAKAHASINELQNAIVAYSKAIEIMPTPDLLFARGNLYEHQIVATVDSQLADKTAGLAYKDYKNVITLTDSEELEKQARLGILRLWKYVQYSAELSFFSNNLTWLKKNTQGRELGEVLYIYNRNGESITGLMNSTVEALDDLNKAIELGYREADVYYLRAIVHYYDHNFGLALKDIELAISIANEGDSNIEYLELRAAVLTELKQFDAASKCFEQILLLSRGKIFDPWGALSIDENEILHRRALARKFSRE